MKLACYASGDPVTIAMYARAKQIIQPGVPELTMFSELNARRDPSRRRALSDSPWQRLPVQQPRRARAK